MRDVTYIELVIRNNSLKMCFFLLLLPVKKSFSPYKKNFEILEDGLIISLGEKKTFWCFAFSM